MVSPYIPTKLLISSTDNSSNTYADQERIKLIPSDKKHLSAPLTEDEAEILKSSRRRKVLKLLTDEKYTKILERLEDDFQHGFSAQNLAMAVSAWENNKEVDLITEQEYNSAHSTLLQDHLPRLENDNFIDYESSDNGTRVLGVSPHVEKFDTILDYELTSSDLLPGTEDKYKETLDWSGLEVDDAIELLANDRRQGVLHYMRKDDVDDLVRFDDLCDQLTAWETNSELGEYSSDERLSVYTGLKQFHLPKLDDHSVIDYDTDRGIIRKDIYFENVVELVPDYPSILQFD